MYAVALNEEQRRARDLELVAANGLVDSLLANSDAMISIRHYDSRGSARYTLANPKVRSSTLGLSVDQIVGQTQAAIDPDPRSAQDVREEDLAVLESNRSQVSLLPDRCRGDRRFGRWIGGSWPTSVTKFPVATADGESTAVGSIAPTSPITAVVNG